MKLSDIQEQLKAQGIEAGEDAIADKLKVLDIKEKDITSDIQELVIQDLVQSFQDEQNSSAIAPRKRTQKQAIAEVREWFAQLGLNYTESEVKTRLQDHNINATDVTIEWVQDWAVQIKRSAIAPVEPNETQPKVSPEVIEIPWEAQQAIASGADVMRLNVARYVEQQESELQETTDLLVKYNRTLEARLWTGVGQQLKTQSSSFDIAKANREGWDKLKTSLKTAIANVNDSAGVKSDAA